MRGKGRSIALAAAALLVFAGASLAGIDGRLTGNYRGTFIGDDYGWFLIDVNADGSITGIVHSNVSFKDMEVAGTCAVNGEVEFTTAGEDAVPLYFLGKIDFMNRFIGKWSYTDHSGRGSFYGMIQRE
jgi:hypothetical protein